MFAFDWMLRRVAVARKQHEHQSQARRRRPQRQSPTFMPFTAVSCLLSVITFVLLCYVFCQNDRLLYAAAATNKIFKTAPCPSASWQGYFDISGAVIESGGERHGDCTITIGPSTEQHLTAAGTQRMMLRFEILDIQSCVDRLIMYDDTRREESSRIAELSCGNEAQHLGFFYTRSSYLTLRYFTYNINGRKPSQFRLIVTAVNQKFIQNNEQHQIQEFSQQQNFANPTKSTARQQLQNGTAFCNSTSRTDYYCQNRHCISRDLVCDDIDHCGDQSDESFCAAHGILDGSSYGGNASHRASALATYRLIGIGIALVLCVILSMGGFCMLVCRESAPFRPQLGVCPTDPAVRASICATRTASLTNFHDTAHSHSYAAAAAAAATRKSVAMNSAVISESSAALTSPCSPSEEAHNVAFAKNSPVVVLEVNEANAARQRALLLERQIFQHNLPRHVPVVKVKSENENQYEQHQHITVDVERIQNLISANDTAQNECTQKKSVAEEEAAQDRLDFANFLRFYAAIAIAEDEEEQETAVK